MSSKGLASVFVSLLPPFASVDGVGFKSILYPPPPPPPDGAPERSFFNDLLEKLHLGDLDAGDLLLLLLLFYLSRQKADEELLIAIGLLLIL